MTMELNMVEQRLVKLQSRWQDFLANDEKRMLVWRIQENATRLLEAFFEVQRHERLQEKPYACSDTFIVFDTPFNDSISYSRQLKEALAGQYAASHETFEQAGYAADWVFEPASLPDSAYGFVQGLNAFARHHENVLGMLVAVMLPGIVSRQDAWSDWLIRALQAAPSKAVRLIVLDSLENPRCTSLVKLDHPQLRMETLAIDIFDLAGETFAQEPAVGSPGVFRSLLMGLVALVERGSPEQVMVKANDAIAFARREGWGDQEVAVRMMAAGAMLKARRFDQAVNHFRHARTTAERLVDEAHPAGQELVLQAWFGEASAHFAAEDLPETIRCYTEAEPVAQTVGKPVLWIESLRMAALCHQRVGATEAAMQCCERALKVGERMKPEARGMTTLPLVCMESLRLTDAESKQLIEAIMQRLESDLEGLNQALEKGANELEQGPDAAEALKALEQRLGDKQEALVTNAGREIDRVVAAANPNFIRRFDEIRALLWRTWPLDPAADELAVEAESQKDRPEEMRA